MKEDSVKNDFRNEIKKRNIGKQLNNKELINACYDEYVSNISNGLNERQAFDNAISSLIDVLELRNAKNNNRYKYIFLVSGISLIISLTLFLVGWLTSDVLNVYSVLYPICLFFSFGVLIHLFVTRKNRKLIDFIIAFIIMLGFLCINIESFLFFYRARTGEFFYTLYYNFPGLLEFCTHSLISQEPSIFEITNTIYLFDPTLIINFICFMFSIFMCNVERRKKHVGSIS